MQRELILIALMSAAVTSGAADHAGTTGTGHPDAVELERYRGAQSPYVFRASDLIGRDVVNAAGTALGDIDDLVLWRGDKSVQAVLAIGGVLGVGERLVAVPYGDLRVSADGDQLFINATDAELKARPAFSYNEGERGGLFALGDDTAGEDADNTARNVRDREGAGKTPEDQSSAETDVDTTRQIRKTLVDDDSLSVDAQNIKIITEGGRVTLRGPVNSVAERERLLAIAKAHAGKNTVQNELEVAQD